MEVRLDNNGFSRNIVTKFSPDYITLQLCVSIDYSDDFIRFVGMFKAPIWWDMIALKFSPQNATEGNILSHRRDFEQALLYISPVSYKSRIKGGTSKMKIEFKK